MFCNIIKPSMCRKILIKELKWKGKFWVIFCSKYNFVGTPSKNALYKERPLSFPLNFCSLLSLLDTWAKTWSRDVFPHLETSCCFTTSSDSRVGAEEFDLWNVKLRAKTMSIRSLTFNMVSKFIHEWGIPISITIGHTWEKSKFFMTD